MNVGKKNKKIYSKVWIVFILSMNIWMGTIQNKPLASSDYLANQELIEQKEMAKDVLYQYFQMDSSSDSNAIKTKRDVYTYTLKQTNSVRLATWTYAKADDYALAPLTEIAKDYEKHHPGWIVLGGVNAEGYYQGELTNAFVQDYDVIRKDVSAESFKELIGFKDDGSIVIKQVPVSSDYPRLKVDDVSFDVTKINAVPDENGISILFPDLIGTLDVSGYHVIEGTYSLYRKSEEFPNPNKTHSGSFYGIFVKGIINQELIEKEIIQAPQSRKFYIVTKNETVVSHLTDGKEIKCQFDYIDEFSDVRSMVGYMYKYLENGVTIPQSYVDVNDVGENVVYDCEYYKSISKQRCGIGFKEDGTIVLLTTNNQTGGPTQYEVGEMFKELGCINAYQFDGGGSVTFIKRDDSGEIKMMNTPGDGRPRSIMSGLFIVVKDPLFEMNTGKTTAETISLKLKENEYTKEVKNIKVTTNNKEYPVENNEVKLTGLEENTEYHIKIEYEEQGQTYETSLYARTKTYDPGIDINPTSKGFDIGLRQTDENLITSKITMQIEEKTYIIENEEGTKEKYTIEDFYKGETYRIKYTYEVTIKENKEKYTREVEEKEYQTLTYETPKITEYKVEQKRGKINITYDYEDKDNLIQTIYIKDNTNKIEIEKGSYQYNIEDDGKEHKIQLIIQYTTPEGIQRNIKSEETTIEHTHEWIEATCDKAKTCSICGITEGVALGHEISEWITDEEATCTKEGKQHKECTRCHETIEEQNINKTEHNWIEATCEKAKTCSICGITEGVALGHEISEWITDEEATCTKEGKQHKECTRCHETIEEQSIDKTEHNWIEATTEKPKTCSICGQTEGEKKAEEKGCKNKKNALQTILTSIIVLCTSIYIVRKKR